MKNLVQLLFCVLSVITIYSCNSSTMEFYVSPSGNDNNTGTKNRPFQSIYKAKEAVSKLIAGGVENKEIYIYFRGGKYFFSKSLVLNGEEFSAGNNKIIFSSYNNEKPVFSSGILLSGWKKLEKEIPYLPEGSKGKIWVANIPDGISDLPLRFLCNDSVSFPIAVSGDLYTAEDEAIRKDYNDMPEEMERGNAGPPGAEKLSSFVFPNGSLRDWENLEDIEILTRPHYAWVVNILPLKSVNTKDNTAQTTIPGTYRICMSSEPFNPNLWVQNAIDYLDKPGEWVINSAEKKIYYWPEAGEPENVICPCLKELIRVEGSRKDNCILKNIEFRGITFTQGNRDIWESNDIGLQHDWAIYNKSDALLRFVDTESCMVDNCTFTLSGGGGVRFDFYSQKNKVENCRFNNLGGTPILLAGNGPGHENTSKNNEIVNNEIHDFGQAYLHSPGIFVWQSGNNRIAHNLVYNGPYNGIVVSGPRPLFFMEGLLGDRREQTGTFSYDKIENGIWNDWDKLFPFLYSENNIIENNELHDIVLKLDDGNAIYLSGTGYNNIVRRNYIHDNTSTHRHGAIRGDGFSKDLTITENIIYRFARYAIVTRYPNTITNNYMIDYIPTERGDGEKHGMISFLYIAACGPIKGSIIKNNIYYQSSGVSEPFVSMRYLNPFKLTYDDDVWPPRFSDCKMDSNLYFSTGVEQNCINQLNELIKQGVDSNSVVADPCFVGLQEAGFKLKNNSPAWKLGIKQIDFGSIGLLK